MRHHKAGTKLNRTGSHRNAMFRNMVTSLLEHGRIRTTDAKAKQVRRWADRMITLAKRGDLHARRQALSVVRDKAVVHKLFEEAPKRFGDRAGGYTQIHRIGRRAGDAAPLSLVELVSAKEKQKEKKKRPKGSKKLAERAKKPVPAELEEKEITKEAEAEKKVAKQAVPETEKEATPEPEDDQVQASEQGAAETEGAQAQEDKESQ